jgi:hypothetical protein
MTVLSLLLPAIPACCRKETGPDGEVVIPPSAVVILAPLKRGRKKKIPVAMDTTPILYDEDGNVISPADAAVPSAAPTPSAAPAKPRKRRQRAGSWSTCILLQLPVAL